MINITFMYVAFFSIASLSYYYFNNNNSNTKKIFVKKNIKREKIPPLSNKNLEIINAHISEKKLSKRKNKEPEKPEKKIIEDWVKL